MARDVESLKIRRWAETGDRVDPDAVSLTPPVSRSVGWPASFSQVSGNTPRRQVFNQLIRELTGIAHEINTHGCLLDWDTSITYQHTAFVVGSNGNVYVSKQNSQGEDPTTDVVETYWRGIVFPTSSDSTKLSGIETGATADQTGAEISSALDTHLGSANWRTGGGGNAGTITSVTAGTGLSGGGSSGGITISIQDPVTANDRTKLDAIGLGGADLTWREAWVNALNNAYPAGSIVTYDNAVYIAIVDVDAASRTNPANNTSNWKRIDGLPSDATTSAKGIVEIGTAEEVRAKSPANVVVTAGNQQLPASTTDADRGKYVKRASSNDGYVLVAETPLPSTTTDAERGRLLRRSKTADGVLFDTPISVVGDVITYGTAAAPATGTTGTIYLQHEA